MINPISKIDAVRGLYGRDSYHKCSGNGEVVWKDGHVITAEEISAIDARYAELVVEYDAQEYARSRKTDYPDIGDQLDALYHAGVFPANMAARIKETKDKYPK